jgi:hypothetical protein
MRSQFNIVCRPLSLQQNIRNRISNIIYSRNSRCVSTEGCCLRLPVWRCFQSSTDSHVITFRLLNFQIKNPDFINKYFLFRSKIENETNIDIGYWESLLSHLQIYMARTRLHDRHQLTLKRKLQKIKQEQGIFHAPVSTSTISNKKKDNEHIPLDSFNDNEIESFDDFEIKCLHEYEHRCYSPELFNINDLDFEIQKYCIDEIDDWDKLKQQRQSVISSGSVKPDVEDAFEAFARSMGSLTTDDSLVNTVIPLNVQYLWSDKYRPRKPRVFNKVHTVCIKDLFL